MEKPRLTKPMRLAKEYTMLLFALSVCSCHFSEQGRQLDETVKFVHFLKENQQQAVYDDTYHADYNVTDSEMRKFEVKKAAQLIQIYGLSTTDKWVYLYNPHNIFDRYQFRIPLFDGFDSTSKLLHAAIVISFPPPEISNKIYAYEIETKYAPSGIKSIAAPPRVTKADHNDTLHVDAGKP